MNIIIYIITFSLMFLLSASSNNRMNNTPAASDELNPSTVCVISESQVPADTGKSNDSGLADTGKSNDSEAASIVFMGEKISAPGSYPGVPDLYAPVLDALFILQQHMKQGDYGSGEYLEAVGFEEYPYLHDGKLGYALVDLNGDGILELLLGTIEGLNNSAPNSIFTLKDGKPVLLGSYWNRSRGVIAADGTIYSAGSGGADYTYLSSYRLDRLDAKNEYTLTQLTDIRSDYSASEGKPYYFQIVNDKNHYITEIEFYSYFEKYYNPSDKISLTVIAIV